MAKRTINETVSSFPTSYTTNGSINGTRYKNCIGKGSDTSNTTGNDYSNGGNSSTAYINYTFSFNIPTDAIIENIDVKVKGHLENTSRSTAKLQLYSGSTLKGEESNFTSTTDAVITMTPGTWSAEELNNAILRFTIGYYGGLISGATWTVTYKIDEEYFTITTSTNDSEISINPSSEEVIKSKDTSFMIEGDFISDDILDNIKIYDNGILQTDNIELLDYINTYSVSDISGAGYNFKLTNDWYVSQNKGIGNSAALCRINLDLCVKTKVIITYINYAEATYDFGILGKLDTELTLDYPVSTSSGGDKTIDEGLFEKRLNNSSDNKSTQQTLEYIVDSGQHFIDIKFGKDAQTNSNNDTLQFKVSLEPINPIPTTKYIKYTIKNVQQDHTILVKYIKFYVKVNGEWQKTKNIYIKQNNIWVKINPTEIPTNVLYLNGRYLYE